MYKIIAIDLDETLLNDSKHVSEDDIKQISQLQDCKVVIATGRGFASVQENLKEMGIYNKEKEYVISSNGGCITENKDNRLLFVQSIPYDDVEFLFNLGCKYDFCIHIYTLETTYTYNLYENERKLLNTANFNITEFNTKDLSFLKDKIVTKVLFGREDIDYLKMIRKEINLEDRFSISLSSQRYLEFNEKSINIKGITNGIDFERYDPRDTTISCLPYAFSPEDYEMEGKYLCRDYLINTVQNVEKIPNIKKYGHIKSESSKDVFICYHGRITSQKGLNVLLNAIPVILNNFNNVKFIIGGQGESSLEKQVIELTEKNEGNIIYFNGYNKEIARLINAVGDFIILPSYFEPCGLEDFISQLYGTLPIAHATGGLKKIVNYKTGFLYSNNTTESLISKISEVVTIKNYSEQTIKKMIKYSSVYIRNKYLWKTVVKNEYLKFFNKILKKS